jgi:general secretion pathway protein K
VKRNDRDGAVLVVVLLVLAAASFLIMESAMSLRVDYANAATSRVSTSGGNLLLSGYTVASELLMEDLRVKGDNEDHRFDVWNDLGIMLESFSDSLQSGDLSGSITPENSRISLKTLSSTTDDAKQMGEVFVRLLEGLCSSHDIEADPKKYLASIKIWAGAKDTLRDADWYRGRKIGYDIPKPPFSSPDELALVHWDGVEQEDVRKIYYGANGIPGLREFVTVWGNGKININTAPDAILAAIISQSDLRESFVTEVKKYRNNGANQFSTARYKTLASGLGVDMSAFPSRIIVVKSKAFRVSLSALVGAGRVNSTAVIGRSPKGCVVLFENMH